MSTGKPTNLTWIQKLDDLMPPEGSSFDKVTAWEKLHEKLEGNQQARKVIWVWWAAASVILLIGVFLLQGINHTRETSTPNIVKKNNKAVNFPPTEKELPGPPVEKTSQVIVIKNNQTGKKPGKKFRVAEKKKPVDIIQQVISGQNSAVNNQAANSIDTGIVKKTNAIAVPFAIHGKKLAVVYNNELVAPETIESPPASSSTEGIFPVFRKIVMEDAMKTEDRNEPSVKYKKRLLPFGNSYKPKD